MDEIGDNLAAGDELSQSARDAHYLRWAYRAAWNLSDDPHTKNGAFLVPVGLQDSAVAGANRLPRGVHRTDERLDRPAKYEHLVHAECDVIYVAAQAGVPTLDATMYCCWAPCLACANAIIAAGITELVSHKQMHDRGSSQWDESIRRALGLLDEAGVIHRQYDGPIQGVDALIGGERWRP